MSPLRSPSPRCLLSLACGILLLATARPVLGQRCDSRPVCVTAVKHDGGLLFQVYNRTDAPQYVTISPQMDNLVAYTALPHTDTYPPGGPHHAFEARPRQRGKAWSYRYEYTWKPAFKQELNCHKEAVCLIREQRGDTLRYYVQNLSPDVITARLDFDGQNVAFGAQFPYLATVHPGRLRQVFDGLVVNASSPWRTMEQWIYGEGDAAARHDDHHVYALPYAPGEGYLLGQGPGGAFSHRGTHALDFNMPRGATIRAARAGRVVDVVQRYGDGLPEEAYKDKSNHVYIRHTDGTLGAYAHLERYGALVEVGDLVETGQPIGLVGNSGFSNGPHLHFEVRTLTPDIEYRSVPIRFLTADGPAHLVEGRRYTAR